jgi:hypothetical protein
VCAENLIRIDCVTESPSRVMIALLCFFPAVCTENLIRID